MSVRTDNIENEILIDLPTSLNMCSYSRLANGAVVVSFVYKIILTELSEIDADVA